jgi:hypothetical protein
MFNALLQAHKGTHDPTTTPNTTALHWEKAVWDGNPIADPCSKNRNTLCTQVFPGRIMLGIKDLYDKQRPFCDPMKPTMAEVEAWNLEVFKHFRKLMGVEIPVRFTKQLMINSRLSDERKFTSVWDSQYPSEVCSKNIEDFPHCGAWFQPSWTEKIPYWGSDGPTEISYDIEKDGIMPVDPSWPISMSLPYAIMVAVCQDGMIDHTSPMLNARDLGYSYYYDTKNAWFRLKSADFGPETCPGYLNSI